MQTDVSPVEKKEGEDSREVCWRGVGWQVKHKQNNNTACSRHQVVQLRTEKRRNHVQELHTR